MYVEMYWGLRLLKLPRTPWKGGAETSSIGEAPEYEAVSYRWGKPRDFSFVECLVQSFSVRLPVNDSFYYALRRLREKKLPRLF